MRKGVEVYVALAGLPRQVKVALAIIAMAAIAMLGSLALVSYFAEPAYAHDPSTTQCFHTYGTYGNWWDEYNSQAWDYRFNVHKHWIDHWYYYSGYGWYYEYQGTEWCPNWVG